MSSDKKPSKRSERSKAVSADKVSVRDKTKPAKPAIAPEASRLPNVRPQDLANRELSFLAFNERVLALANDNSIPLLERLRFLCISSSNLDEFFEVRVAGIKQKIQGGVEAAGIDGSSPQQELNAINESAQDFVARQYQLLNDTLRWVWTPRIRFRDLPTRASISLSTCRVWMRLVGNRVLHWCGRRVRCRASFPCLLKYAGRNTVLCF